jgi:hypothetical protein
LDGSVTVLYWQRRYEGTARKVYKTGINKTCKTKALASKAYTVYEILDTVHCIGSSSNADEMSGGIWPMTVSAYTKQMQSRRGSSADIARFNSCACVAVGAVSAVGQAVVMGQLPLCLLQSTVCLVCLSTTLLWHTVAS